MALVLRHDGVPPYSWSQTYVSSVIGCYEALTRFADAWATFTERRDGAIRVMLCPQEK